MKILLLSQFFSSTRGGGEYMFSMMAKLLAQNGHKVWIITNKILNENYPTHENLHFVFVPPDLEYKGGLPPRFSENITFIINAIRKGRKIIKSEHIDLIHSNNFSPAFAGATLAYLTSKPHVTSIWDVFTLCGKDYWKRWTKQQGISKINQFFGPQFEKLVLHFRHSAIHTISNASKDDLINFGAKKSIYVIPPCVEETETKNNSVNKFQFIFVGRLVFYKNLELVIKAVSIAKNTENKIKLVIIGDGPYRQNLENFVKKLKAESNVEFKGYTSHDEKIRLISQSNSMVFPSLCEGFGLVILEAFSQAKPVLVSDVKPMSEIISNGKTGFVLDPYDANVWAKQILKMIEKFDLSNSIGKNGREELCRFYAPQIMYNRLIKMYDEVIS